MVVAPQFAVTTETDFGVSTPVTAAGGVGVGVGVAALGWLLLQPQSAAVTRAARVKDVKVFM
jgi:hypothetical protein